MRRLLLALALSVSVPLAMTGAVAVAAPAVASQEAARALQQLETTSYQVATSFFLYSVLNRDPQHLKKTQANVAAGDALVQKVGNATVTSKWNGLKQSISSAKFTSEGVADNTSLIAIDAAITSLTQVVRSQRMEQRIAANMATDKMADMLYDQHVLMQTMTTAYLRNSADYFGGAIVQSQGPQVEIDKLAARFQAQQDQLNRHYAKKPEVAAALREVTTKWTFIRASFINYNENNVPFIVGRYNEQITEKLLQAYESLQ